MGACGRKWGNMFVGESQHILDEKFRLVLPVKFREELGSTFFAFIDFDHCLSLYTREGYEKRASQILSLDQFSSDARKLKRIFFGNSIELSTDKVGRILIPKNFLDKAGISREVSLIGVYDHLEMWDRNIYSQQSLEEENDYLSLAEKLAGGEGK